MTLVPGTRLMQVQRGNIGVALPITPAAFERTPVGELAGVVAAWMFGEQQKQAGRADEPIRLDDTPLALRLPDRDKPLNPDLPLGAQTEGRWHYRDVPVQAQTAATARLPVCQFDLIDVERPAIVVASLN